MKVRSKGGDLIAKIHQSSGRIFSRILRKAGIDEINPAQGRILFVLWNKDEIPITELARNTMLSKSTLTSMLDRLEKTGYIIRKRSEHDRRTILIKRTEKDKRLESKYVQVSEEMIRLFYDGFTTTEIKELENKLERLLSNLVRYEAKHEENS